MTFTPLNALNAFIAVARHRSFAAAARHLGTVTTNDTELMRVLAVAGVGLLYMFEPDITDELRRGRLCLVLEQYAAAVPGFFLYFPSRAQVSPALRAFVDVAREMATESKQRA